MVITDRVKEYFFNNFIPEPNSGCWLWADKLDQFGYGLKKINYIHYRMHRFSYYIHSGINPGKFYVCHKCDTPSCVNPDHLFLGTQKDNILDMVQKGRFKPSNKRKLTVEKVLEIHNLYRSKSYNGRELGELFGVSKETIYSVLKGRRWRIHECSKHPYLSLPDHVRTD